MAISFVGSATGTSVAANYDVTLPTVQPGDLALVLTGTANDDNIDVGVNTAGYTELFDLYVNDSRDTNFAAAYKIMGEPPDTVVNVIGSNAAFRGSATVVYVLRGADQTTPIDVTPTTATLLSSIVPNPPSITPVTSGAWVVAAFGMGANAADAVGTEPAGYSNLVSESHDPGISFTVGVASFEWTSGAHDPGTFTNYAVDGGNAAQCCWAAASIAIRPATTGAIDLAGAAAAVLTAVGAIVQTVAMTGAGVITSTATGVVNQATSLAGSAAGVTVANGVATLAMSLSGAGLVQSLGNAAATMALSLDGAAIASALAAADLGVGGTDLAGAAQSAVTATAAMFSVIPMSGSASASVQGVGNITYNVPLSGSAEAIVGANGNVMVSVGLSAAAVAQVQAVGNITLSVPLSAAALSQALAAAHLFMADLWSGLIIENYTLRAPERNYTLKALA